MHLDDLAAPRTLVQEVDVLGHDRADVAESLELGQGHVRRRSARRRRASRSEARRTPRPCAGSRAERLDRAVLERIELRPQPRGGAEVGDPALGRDARAGENERGPALPEQLGQPLNAHVDAIVDSRADGRLRASRPSLRCGSRRPTRRRSLTTPSTSSGSRSRGSTTSRASRRLSRAARSRRRRDDRRGERPLPGAGALPRPARDRRPLPRRARRALPLRVRDRARRDPARRRLDRSRLRGRVDPAARPACRPSSSRRSPRPRPRLS